MRTKYDMKNMADIFCTALYNYDVYQLNDEANLLYTPHAYFIRSGYAQPKLYGEEFTQVEYVVTELVYYNDIPDYYTEEATLLATFDKSVKLEDVIESESSNITVSEKDLEECNEIRFKYKNHADMFLTFYIYGVDGVYYLDIRDSVDGTHEWFEIKPEYVDLLTSAIAK